MNILKDLLLLEESQPGVLMEKMTSPHVLSRSDITVILNLIDKTFGLDYGIESDIGLCLLSQVVFSIAAATGIDVKELSSFLKNVSKSKDYDPKIANNLGKLIAFFNNVPIDVGNKKIQLTLNAHPINDANEMKKELSGGQPIICAVPTGGTVDTLIGEIQEISKYKNVDQALEDNPLWSLRGANDAEKKLYYKELYRGVISTDLWRMIRKTHDNQEWRDDTNVYHASLCFGYEAGDKAFLFREPRHNYARKGYYKIAEALFTSKNLGSKKSLIHGMFYVEVVDMKEVKKVT